MKLALFSDTHNNWNGLQSAIDKAETVRCDVALFAGDLDKPAGVEVLAEFSGPVHHIVGNIDTRLERMQTEAARTNNVIYHGEVCDISRDGLRIFMNHYPEVVAAKAQQDTYDLCVHGHTHQFRDEKVGSTRLINPGALTRRRSRPEWASLDTETGELVRHNV